MNEQRLAHEDNSYLDGISFHSSNEYCLQIFTIFRIFPTNNLKTSTRNNAWTLCFTEIIWEKSGKIFLEVQHLLFS